MLFTFNTNLLTATAFQGLGYDSPPIKQAVRALRPRGLRFPGGTIANNYLWKEDPFSEPTNDKTKWAPEQLRLFRKIGRPYDLQAFTLCLKSSKSFTSSLAMTSTTTGAKSSSGITIPPGGAVRVFPFADRVLTESSVI